MREVPLQAKTEVATVDRTSYAHTFGPTTGDKIYLGDTGLIAQV